MPRLTGWYLLLLVFVSTELHAADGNRQPGALAGPPPYQRVVQAGDQAIELYYAVSKPVFERQVNQVANAQGKIEEQTRTVQRQVTEHRVCLVSLDRIEASISNSGRIKAKELGKRLAGADVVAVFPYRQKPDAAYLAMLRPDTLVLCVRDSQRATPDQPLAVDPSQLPMTSPLQAAIARIDERGRLQLRRTTTEEFPSQAVRAFDLGGKAIKTEALANALKDETPVWILEDGHAVEPFYLKILRPGTLILVVP